MKDVFDKPCISQVSTRNSTMKLSQPLRRTNNGQYCISFLAPSVWNNLPNEVKRCTSLNTFKHKVKEYFLYKIRRKITMCIFTTRLLSSQKLMHFFSLILNCCLFIHLFIYLVTFYPILVYQFFKVHNGNKATWMLFLYYPSHKLNLDIVVILFYFLFLYIRFYFHVN